jgi:hypothetical protein
MHLRKYGTPHLLPIPEPFAVRGPGADKRARSPCRGPLHVPVSCRSRGPFDLLNYCSLPIVSAFVLTLLSCALSCRAVSTCACACACRPLPGPCARARLAASCPVLRRVCAPAANLRLSHQRAVSCPCVMCVWLHVLSTARRAGWRRWPLPVLPDSCISCLTA